MIIVSVSLGLLNIRRNQLFYSSPFSTMITISANTMNKPLKEGAGGTMMWPICHLIVNPLHYSPTPFSKNGERIKESKVIVFRIEWFYYL